MIRVMRKGLDHTGLAISCRIERSLLAAGGEARVGFVCAPRDRYLPKLNPACGDGIEIFWGETPLFSGRAEGVQFSSDGMSMSLTCFDGASALAKNELYAAFSGTPEGIAGKVLAALGMPVGVLWAPGGGVFIPASCGLSGLGIIRQAYGGRCAVQWNAGKVDILEPGAREIALFDQTLLSGTAALSVGEMVNRAVVIGYKGRADGMAENGGNIAAFGLRQRVFSLSGARSTARSQASGHLRGAVRTARVRLLGGVAAMCGDSLWLGWPEYGLEGRWLVTAVSHLAQAGVLETTLGLEEMA